VSPQVSLPDPFPMANMLVFFQFKKNPNLTEILDIKTYILLEFIPVWYQTVYPIISLSNFNVLYLKMDN
jgi:hypothetical protein